MFSWGDSNHIKKASLNPSLWAHHHHHHHEPATKKCELSDYPGECIGCKFVPSRYVTSLCQISISHHHRASQLLSSFVQIDGNPIDVCNLQEKKKLEIHCLSRRSFKSSAQVGSFTKWWWSDHGHPHQYLSITTMSTHDDEPLRSKELINFWGYVSSIVYGSRSGATHLIRKFNPTLILQLELQSWIMSWISAKMLT